VVKTLAEKKFRTEVVLTKRVHLGSRRALKGQSLSPTTNDVGPSGKSRCRKGKISKNTLGPYARENAKKKGNNPRIMNGGGHPERDARSR